MVTECEDRRFGEDFSDVKIFKGNDFYSIYVVSGVQYGPTSYLFNLNLDFSNFSISRKRGQVAFHVISALCGFII